jgi:hypothetical protein
MMQSIMNTLRKIGSRLYSGSMAMALVVALSFASGYNGVISYNNYCQAQVTATNVTVVGGMCTCCKGCVTPCEVSGTASIVRTTIYSAFYASLTAASILLENTLAMHVDGMVQNLLEKVNNIEKNMIQWWSTMWNYNLNPGLRAMTVQTNTANSDLSKTYQASVDAEHETQTNSAIMRTEMDTARVVRDNVCPPAGLTGGAGRGKTFASAMRGGMQKEAVDSGSNKVGTPGAGSVGEYLKNRTETYEAAFCDPEGNGGTNVCGGTAMPEFYNADTQITKFVYNKLTIPVDDANTTSVLKPDGSAMTVGELHDRAVKESLENMVGSPAMNPVQTEVGESPMGREILLNRRDFLAKYNAVRSVPQLVLSHRMPGSRLGEWIQELRQEAGIPVTEISDNPSYREVINALAVDRFNSGKFANNLQMERTGVEMEKLSMSTFYLIMLRDYHDLLERTALTLAVQVSMMADDVKLPDISNIRPVKRN